MERRVVAGPQNTAIPIIIAQDDGLRLHQTHRAGSKLETIMADLESEAKMSPQKCGNCGREGNIARTCIKGRTNVSSDTLPQTTP
jgi:hypothetical protein